MLPADPQNADTTKRRLVERIQVDNLVYDAGSASVHRLSDDNATVLPTKSGADDSKEQAFTLFGLVTRAVIDAFGRTNSEAYVDFAPLNDLPKYAKKEQAGLRVRLVELQHRRDHSVLKATVFADLFPQSKDGIFDFLEDQKARVVRVSPPISALQKPAN